MKDTDKRLGIPICLFNGLSDTNSAVISFLNNCVNTVSLDQCDRMLEYKVAQTMNKKFAKKVFHNTVVEEEERKQDLFLLIRLVKILNLIKWKGMHFSIFTSFPTKLNQIDFLNKSSHS